MNEIVFSEAPGRAKRLVKNGDTIFATVRPENKAYSLIINPKENTIASTGFAVLSPLKEDFSELIYLIVSSDSFIDEMSLKAKGSAYPQVGFEEISNFIFLFPENNFQLIENFSSTTKPIFQQIETLTQQNAQLRQIRDRLLPRLISGKLEV